MIAANDDPGQRCAGEAGRMEKVRPPARPVVRRRRAVGAFAVRLAVVIVADVQHHVGIPGGNRSGHRGEGPGLRIAAVLHRRADLPAAACIAEDGHFQGPAQLVDRQRVIADLRRTRALRHRGLADRDLVVLGRFGMHPHARPVTVDVDLRTLAAAGHDRARQRTVRTILDPRRIGRPDGCRYE